MASAAMLLADSARDGSAEVSSTSIVAAGHYLAMEAGREILAGGGNAIDAGVAAGVALAVVQSEQVQFAGVAPILIYHAESQRVVAIAGLGPWPRATDPGVFADRYRGRIPVGVLRTVVPAAPDAWLTALRTFGTMGFAEVAASAIRLAREGFPADPILARSSARYARYYRRFEENARIWLPNGAPIAPGGTFVQADLARTLQYMADEENAARSGGRAAGLEAARAAFYVGDIGRAIVRHIQAEGGWLSATDMAAYRSPIEPAPSVRFRGETVYSGGLWCQGPVLLQMLKLVEHIGLDAAPHNAAVYLHRLVEAIKLAFADRETFYGDPDHVAVPLGRLLADDYAAERLRLFDPERAAPGLPAAGDLPGFGGVPFVKPAAPGTKAVTADTSVCCAIDRAGNMFAATPSDASIDAPAVPGLGLVVSTRGSQGFARADHAASIQPGKRPRMTACPTMIVTPGGRRFAGGGPGGDGQPQAMLQVLLNRLIGGMNLPAAVEAPRAISKSFPTSHEPHLYFPGALALEAPFSDAIRDRLTALGHTILPRANLEAETPAVCAVEMDGDANGMTGAADPRLSAGVGEI